MPLLFTPPTPEELSENDSYAGGLVVSLAIGLDITDAPIRTTHDLARLLLQCAPTPLDVA
jgi:hypothetical protein